MMLCAQGQRQNYMTENEKVDYKKMYQHAAVPEYTEG